MWTLQVRQTKRERERERVQKCTNKVYKIAKQRERERERQTKWERVNKSVQSLTQSVQNIETKREREANRERGFVQKCTKSNKVYKFRKFGVFAQISQNRFFPCSPPGIPSFARLSPESGLWGTFLNASPSEKRGFLLHGGKQKAEWTVKTYMVLFKLVILKLIVLAVDLIIIWVLSFGV